MDALTQVERDLLNWFSTPQSAKEIFCNTFPESLRMECDDYREKLAKEGMLKGWTAHHGEVPVSMSQTIGLAFLFMFILAFFTHSTLVFFLLFFSILTFGPFASFFVNCRPSRTGKAHLRQVEQQYAPLNNPTTLPHQVTVDDMFIALAVFGPDVLLRTKHDAFAGIVNSAGTSGWSYSFGYGGGCGGDAGGCGGCGGCCG